MPLSIVLQRAGLAPDARYIVFYCADRLGEELGEAGKAKYYESIGLADAFHPQTILAHDMNGAPLGVPYGAPLRLRVERQLGYKMAKYIMRILISEPSHAAFSTHAAGTCAGAHRSPRRRGEDECIKANCESQQAYCSTWSGISGW